MINLKWNGIDFSITDIGGGKLGTDIPRHAHAKGSYELHFITAGSGKLITDDKEYELKSGDFFITGENIYHQQIAPLWTLGYSRWLSSRGKSPPLILVG